MSLSVIIPTYGRPEELERAVRSVQGQTYSPEEIIIVDDNRDDDEARRRSTKVAESVREARVIEFSGRGGGSASRNAGAATANGDLLAFLDDDDWWEPEKLERQVAVYAAAERPDRLGLIYTGLRVVDEDGAFLRERPGRLPEDSVRELARHNFVGTVSSALIPRAVFFAVDGFDEELPARQDLDLWLRIAQGWELRAVEEPLTVYVNHNRGISKNFQKKIRAHELFLAKHRSLYENDRALLAHYQYATGVLCIKHRRHDLAREYLRGSLAARFTGRAAARWLATLLSGS